MHKIINFRKFTYYLIFNLQAVIKFKRSKKIHTKKNIFSKAKQINNQYTEIKNKRKN